MTNSLAGKKGRQMFRLFNGNGTNQNRLSFLMGFCNLLNNCVPFVAFVKVNFIIFVFASYWFVCRNNNNIKVVNLTEFYGFSCSGTSHARKFVVHAEEVLESNGCKGSVSLSNADVFLCFNSLM